VLAAREHCDVQSTTDMADKRIVTLTDKSKIVREVTCFLIHIY
jgi:hypothetical protein